MADTPLALSNTAIDGALKRYYTKFREKAYPLLTPLWANLTKAKRGGAENIRWGGSGPFWDVVLEMPAGGTGSDAGWLPPGHIQTEKQATIPIRTVYHTRSILRRTARATEKAEFAFISLKKKIMNEAGEAHKLLQQEIVHGDGRGIKAVVLSRTSDTEYVIYRPFGKTASGQGALLVRPGLYIAMHDITGADAILGRAKVLTVVPSGDNATITLDTAISGVAAGDLLAAATENDSSLDQMPYGVHAWLNIGGGYDNFLGINAATYDRWDSLQMIAGTDTESTETPDETDIWTLFQRSAGLSGHDASINPEEFIMSTTPGLFKAIGQTFIGQRYLDMENMQEVKGGFKALTICGVPLLRDPWQHAGTFYNIHKPSIATFDMDDFAPLVFEGAGPWRWIEGRDGYSIHYAHDVNVGPLNRIPSSSMTGFTDTERYSHVMANGH